jgi:polyvinyl alcohol dehydrogenase (cytochrome)
MKKWVAAANHAVCLMFIALAGCGDEKPPPSMMAPLTGGSLAVAAGTLAPPPGTGGVGGTGLPGTAGSAAAIGGAGGPVAPGTAGTSGTTMPGTAGTGGNGVVVPPPGQQSQWPMFGGDLNHTRASASEKLISAANAATLKPAFDIKAPGVTATPAVYKGVVYWADWGGIVHATNLVDQKEIWKVDNSAMGGGYTGSPFVTEKAVFVANRNGLLSAIDRETGGKIWNATLDAGAHTHIWSSPVVSEQDNVLVVGVGGLGTRENGVAIPQSQLETFNGWVEGFDSLTGESLWKFQTTPSPMYGAGVSVWSSASLDPVRKMAFIGTGNNYYRPVSPYSDSLLAINYMTGERVWHRQFTMNDAWTVGTVISGGVDGDVGATPNLFKIGDRDVVGVGDKPGSYYVLDRMTGMEVWKTKLTNGSGFQGGVMAPAAVADGMIYVVSNNGTSNSTAFGLNAADGKIVWRHDVVDPTFGGPAYGNGVLFVGDQAGNILALDAKTGKELWKPARLPAGRGGGFSLVDGMLFTGYGFHFSESRREPLMGGLLAYSLDGMVTVMPGAPTSDCIPGTAVTAAPTFTNVYQGVLCADGCAKVCHGSSAEAGLNIETKAGAYQTMVGMAARGDACKAGGQKLVDPMNPMTSVLYTKLAGTPACGLAMPPGSSAAMSTITPAMREAVRAWIAAGAPNN